MKLKIQEGLRIPVLQQRLLHSSVPLQNDELKVGSLVSSSGDEEIPVELTLLIRPPAITTILEILKRDPMALRDAPEELRGDKEVVMEVVKESGAALQHASRELRCDRDVVAQAVRNLGDALEHASEDLKDDKHVVMEAVKTCGGALRYASTGLRDDREVVTKAVQ